MSRFSVKNVLPHRAEIFVVEPCSVSLISAIENFYA